MQYEMCTKIMVLLTSTAAASSVFVVGGGRGGADEFAVLVADEAALGLGLLLRHGSRDDRGFAPAAGGHDVRAAKETRAGRDRGGAPRAERRVAGLAHPGRREHRREDVGAHSRELW